jgi:hypothetical protein
LIWLEETVDAVREVGAETGAAAADPVKTRSRTAEMAAKIPFPFKVFRRLIGLSSWASRFPPIKNPLRTPIVTGLLITGERDLSSDFD